MECEINLWVCAYTYSGMSTVVRIRRLQAKLQYGWVSEVFQQVVEVESLMRVRRMNPWVVCWRAMFSLQKLSHLPVEMLEIVLIRSFLMLYSSDDDSDSVRSVQCRVFTVLSSVCWSWWMTLSGWPQSPTPHWVKHQIIKLMKREYAWIYYCITTLLLEYLHTVNECRYKNVQK